MLAVCPPTNPRRNSWLQSFHRRPNCLRHCQRARAWQKPGQAVNYYYNGSEQSSRTSNVERRTLNLEPFRRGKVIPSHPKPPQGHILAYTRHRLRSTKPPQSHPKATTKPYTRHRLWSTKAPQSHPHATPKPPQSHPKATPRLPQGSTKATPARAKAEIRNPRSEGNPKTEGRKKLLPMGWRPAGAIPGSDFGFRASFGLRLSVFGFPSWQPLSALNPPCSKAAR